MYHPLWWLQYVLTKSNFTRTALYFILSNSYSSSFIRLWYITKVNSESLWFASRPIKFNFVWARRCRGFLNETFLDRTNLISWIYRFVYIANTSCWLIKSEYSNSIIQILQNKIIERGAMMPFIKIAIIKIVGVLEHKHNIWVHQSNNYQSIAPPTKTA